MFPDKKHRLPAMAMLAAAVCSCSGRQGQATRELTVIEPGHFHAALVQKHSLPGISDTVRVYAPKGSELTQYLEYIEAFNSREEEPASWVEDVHVTDGKATSRLQLPETDGGIAVLSGNNASKTTRLLEAVQAGYNILSDKPMAINADDFTKLELAYRTAAGKGLVIYDMMTERYDVLNIITRRLVQDKDLFGGIPDGCRVNLKSVHHFYKEVNGKANRRPEWYYDVTQQGEGIADVSTHFIDLLFWQFFPDTPLEWEKDVKLTGASHFPSRITPGEYELSTGAEAFPEYLKPCVKDGALEVLSNGSLSFKARTLDASIFIEWRFQAPEGSGDTFEAEYKGTGATIRIVQNASTGFSKEIFVEPSEGRDREEFRAALLKAVEVVGKDMEYVSLDGDGMHIVVPAENRLSHEDHFGMVAGHFLDYLDNPGSVPEWENVNTLTKYRLTTEAVSTASRKDAE